MTDAAAAATNATCVAAPKDDVMGRGVAFGGDALAVARRMSTAARANINAQIAHSGAATAGHGHVVKPSMRAPTKKRKINKRAEKRANESLRQRPESAYAAYAMETKAATAERMRAGERAVRADMLASWHFVAMRM